MTGQRRRRYAPTTRHALILLIVVVEIEFPELRLEPPRVFPDEKRGDPVQEDRISVDLVHGVGDGKPFGTVGRPRLGAPGVGMPRGPGWVTTATPRGCNIAWIVLAMCAVIFY